MQPATSLIILLDSIVSNLIQKLKGRVVSIAKRRFLISHKYSGLLSGISVNRSPMANCDKTLNLDGRSHGRLLS